MSTPLNNNQNKSKSKYPSYSFEKTFFRECFRRTENWWYHIKNDVKTK